MKRQVIGAALAAHLLMSSSAVAESVSLPVTEAAHIVSDEGQARVLLRFDAPELPENIVVTSAFLRLPQPAAEVRATYEMVIAAVSRQWSRANVDWRSWDRPGGDFADNSWAHRRVTFVPESREFSADVTSIVNMWVRGDCGAYGVFIMPHPNTAEGMDVRLADLFYAEGGRIEINFKRVGAFRRRDAR